MADYSQAIQLTLQHEGGFVDNPADPGGATNMGIEQREWDGGDIRDITIPQAIVWYEERYWKPLYAQIESQPLANKLFDSGVLFGVGMAVMLLQRAVGVAADGVFGNETLQAVNEMGNVLGAFKAQLLNHIQLVVSAKPQLRVFMQGWVNRVNS